MSLFRRQSLHLPLLVAAWFAVTTGVIGTSVALGVPITAAVVAGWVLLALVPPVMLLTVLRGPGQATLSQVTSGVTPAHAPNVRTGRNGIGR